MALAFTQAQRSLASIRSMLPRLVTAGTVVAGEPTLWVEPANVPPVLDFLKNHSGTRCKQLMDVTAVDVPTREKRFEVQSPACWLLTCNARGAVPAGRHVAAFYLLFAADPSMPSRRTTPPSDRSCLAGGIPAPQRGPQQSHAR